MSYVDNKEAFEIFLDAYYDQMKPQEEEEESLINFAECIDYKSQQKDLFEILKKVNDSID